MSNEPTKDEVLTVTVEALKSVRDLFGSLAEEFRNYADELDRIEEKHFGKRQRWWRSLWSRRHGRR